MLLQLSEQLTAKARFENGTPVYGQSIHHCQTLPLTRHLRRQSGSTPVSGWLFPCSHTSYFSRLLDNTQSDGCSPCLNISNMLALLCILLRQYPLVFLWGPGP